MKISGGMLQLVLCWAIVAFSIATVVVAVQNAKLGADLKEAQHKLDYLESELEGEVKPRAVRSPSLRDESEIIDYRLPASVLPKHYDLYLHPDIESGNFTGQEVINLAVQEGTRQIFLHSFELDIQHVYVSGPFGQNLEVSGFQLDEVRQFLIIDMVEELPRDAQIKLGIIFEGKMDDKIVALYRSSYRTPENELRTIATSKFEPTFARQAFPCFDEPALKATFTITLVQPSGDGYHALSNMNEESTLYLGQYTEVTFAKSVPMSTYLACFIVSDFAHEAKEVNTNGIGEAFEIRIFATAHQLSKVEYALNTAVAVTEFYVQNYKVEYPLPKLDMVAIPDFVSNAMENWGLLTYRETALLYDKSFSSTLNKQATALVVAHELAHMWFGNLVTMMWWNDLWLNEGFARYMQYKGTHAVYSDYGLLDQFLVRTMHSVLEYDATVASHPIIQTVSTPNQITEIFDTITYDKGGSVIRMLEDVVGVVKFEQAVTNYLTNFKYKNAVTDDFIAEIVKLEPGFDVDYVMRTWTVQMGLPVIEVRRGTNQFVLTQKRFFSNIEDYDANYDDSEFNYTWSIPLTFYTDSNSEVQRQWFDNTAHEVSIPVTAATKWIKLNVHQVGYYRVNYEEDVWSSIFADLLATPEKFDIADRAHLINDVFALADASQLSYEVALDITKYLEKELDFVPWSVAASNLKSLQVRLVYTDTYLEYVQYARNLVARAYEEVTWNVDADNHLRNLLREKIINIACSLGVSDCLAQAASKFTAWLAEPENKPEPDLREIVYYYGMQQVGKQQSWEQMWLIFTEEQDASEKLKLMYGLSGIRVPWLLQRFVELAADEKLVRRQDYFSCLQNIAANPVGESIVWEYVREQWPELVERFGLNERYLGRMIPSITGHFSTQTKLEEMQYFFEKYPEAGAGTAARKQALEKVKYNIKWLEENKIKVANWLEKQTTG